MLLNGILLFGEAFLEDTFQLEYILRNFFFLYNKNNQFSNNAEACFYVSDHSECELVVADNREQL